MVWEKRKILGLYNKNVFWPPLQMEGRFTSKHVTKDLFTKDFRLGTVVPMRYL